MSRKKLLKPILIGVAGAGVLGLVLGLSINWSHTQYLQAVGSSGVKPFITALGTKYHNTHNKFDVAVESGGTTFAVEQIAKGYAQLGNASNNPYYTIHPEGGSSEYASKWVDKKTLTLGWEAMVIMYKMPDALSSEAKEKVDILITKDNILDLYAVFSGFNESMVDGQVKRWEKDEAILKNSMYNYLSPESKTYFDAHSEQKDILLKTPITPFLRSGGNTGANSSIAFTYYSNLVDFTSMTPNQQSAFKGGQYGNDHKFYETDESNAHCWTSFTSHNLSGSMTYMSSGFLAFEGNRQLMKKLGYKVASYLPKVENATPVKIMSDDYSEVYINKICKDKGYNWYRPINVMIDLNIEKSKNFLYWVYTGKEKDEEVTLYDPSSAPLATVMEANGARTIGKPEFESMMIQSETTSNIYERLFSKQSSDIELEKTRSAPDAETYGAIDVLVGE